MESVLQSLTFVMLRIHVAERFHNRMLRKDVGENRKALAEFCASKTTIIIHYPLSILHYQLIKSSRPKNKVSNLLFSGDEKNKIHYFKPPYDLEVLITVRTLHATSLLK